MDPLTGAAIVGGVASVFGAFSSSKSSERMEELAEEQHRWNVEQFERTQKANREIGEFNIGVTERNRKSQLGDLYEYASAYRASALVSTVASGLKLDEDRKFFIDREVMGKYAKAKEDINFNAQVQTRNLRSQMEGATIAAQAQLNQSWFQKEMIASQARTQLMGGIYDSVKTGISMYRHFVMRRSFAQHIGESYNYAYWIEYFFSYDSKYVRLD